MKLPDILRIIEKNERLVLNSLLFQRSPLNYAISSRAIPLKVVKVMNALEIESLECGKI